MTNHLHHHLVRFSERILPARTVSRLRQMVQSRRTKRNLSLRVRRENQWQQKQGHGDTVIKLQAGVKMRLYFDSLLCRHIFLDEFENEERLFLNLFLRPGDVFVDVGANIGLFTLIAGRLIGPTGKVHAFEPCSKTFARLQTNVALNRFDNVECHQIALSDASQTMEIMASTEGLDGWNSFARPYMGESFSTESVATTTWNEWVTTHNLGGHVTMMKIDVEGWEGKVLQGAHSELARGDAPLLQVEFTDAAAQSAGLSCQEVYRHLNQLGYEVCRFDAVQRCLVPDPIREAYPYCNLFAVKDLPAAQSRLRGDS